MTQRRGEGKWQADMGGCQIYGSFLGPYYNTALILL